jgi:hypothetical protein
MFEHLNQGAGSIPTLFFAFAIFHALADFALQNAFIARSKIPGADLSDFFGSGRGPRGLWVHSLTAHSLLHGGGVWIVSGSAALGLTEFILHWLIDFIKGRDLISFHLDQILHLSCKLGYAAFIAFAII